MKRCAKCGTAYDVEAYRDLNPPAGGEQQFAGGLLLLLRNCECGNTLAWACCLWCEKTLVEDDQAEEQCENCERDAAESAAEDYYESRRREQ